MLLRASGQRESRDFNLNAVNEADSDPGVDHASHLRLLTEAAIDSRWQQLAAIRDDAAAAMGEQAMVDALTVAAGFNGITRVADATGIPLDPTTQKSRGPCAPKQASMPSTMPRRVRATTGPSNNKP